jgi:hypothetical protein
MERFREHEKEFKLKQFSKKALKDMNEMNGNFVSSDEDDEDMDKGSHEFSNSGNSDEGLSLRELLEKDREWLSDYAKINLQEIVHKIESELELIKNKKIRGASKKYKEKMVSLTTKLNHARKCKELLSELILTADSLEGGSISILKMVMKEFVEGTEEEQALTNLEEELAKMIDQAEENHKS